MKFVSKMANYHVVLRPGIPAQPITGTPAVPTLSVRFHSGMAEVNDQQLIDRMMNHEAYNIDFISVQEMEKDPFASMRSDIEPTHITTDLKFGTPVKRTAPTGIAALPPEIAKLVQEQAASLAKEMVSQMLPSLVSETVKGLADAQAKQKETIGDTVVQAEDSSITVIKKSPGRPKRDVAASVEA